MKKSKLLTIDVLRVLFSISIMVYHYTSWSGGDTTGILDILSIYAVEGFFVISGIVLIYNYHENFKCKDYFIHRFFRIATLFYLAIFFELLRHYNSAYFGYGEMKLFSENVLSNITFFHIFNPHLTSVVSGWSIMVEVGLYLMFPFLLMFFLRYKVLVITTVLIVYTIITFFLFNIYLSASDGFNNEIYTNVFFHLPFFVFGMFIGYIKVYNIEFSYFIPLSIVSIALLYFLNIESQNDLILNQNRYLLFIMTLLLIGYFVFNDFLSSFNLQVQKIIIIFSNLTYSIYLLHFFIFYIGFTLYGIKNLYFLMFCTILVSLPTYYYYERYFIKLGKKYVK